VFYGRPTANKYWYSWRFHLNKSGIKITEYMLQSGIESEIGD
jgi:hypothetical protein